MKTLIQHNLSMAGELPIFVFKQGKSFIAKCPSLDLVSQGKTYQEALDAIKEVVDIFFEETSQRKTLPQALADLGWMKAGTRWAPPIYIGRADIQIPANA